eukprot:jgi/Bigna1/67113/fgenesh1_pg.3_\
METKGSKGITVIGWCQTRRIQHIILRCCVIKFLSEIDDEDDTNSRRKRRVPLSTSPLIQDKSFPRMETEDLNSLSYNLEEVESRIETRHENLGVPPTSSNISNESKPMDDKDDFNKSDQKLSAPAAQILEAGNNGAKEKQYEEEIRRLRLELASARERANHEKKKAETAMNAARALRDMIPNRNSGFDKRSIKESLQVNSSQTGNVIPYMGHDSIEGAVLHLDILEANAKIVNLEWEKKQIKAECEHLRRSLDTRKDSTTKLFKTHEEIYSLTRRLRQEAHERSADWSRCCRKHADDIHRLAKGLERVQKGLEGMRRVAVRMKSNVLVFRKDMTRQLAFVSSKLSQLERLDNTKRLKLERISTHKKSLEKELLQSKKEIRRVGAWAKSVLTENEINQRSHKDLESKHNDLKEQFRLFKAGRKLMQQHLTSLLKENENLTSEKNDLEIQLQDLHSNSTKRIVQVVDEVLSQMNNHTKDNKQR